MVIRDTKSHLVVLANGQQIRVDALPGQRVQVVRGRVEVQRRSIAVDQSEWVDDGIGGHYRGITREVEEMWAWTVHDAGWVTAARIMPSQNGPVIAEIRTYPYEPDDRYTREANTDADAPILVGDLRDPAGRWSGNPASVPFQGLTARQARAAVARLDDLLERIRTTAKDPGIAPDRPYPWAEYRDTYLPRGRPPTPDHKYAIWADRYEQTHATVGRRVIQALAEAYPNTPVDTIRSYISEARRRGLLTRVGRGKAGGRLTPKGEQTLAAAAQAKGEAE